MLQPHEADRLAIGKPPVGGNDVVSPGASTREDELGYTSSHRIPVPDATEELFARKGSSSVSVNEIAIAFDVLVFDPPDPPRAVEQIADSVGDIWVGTLRLTRLA